MSYFLYNGVDSREFGILEGVPMPPSNDEIVKTVETAGHTSDAYYTTGRYDYKGIPVVLGIKDKSKLRALYSWLTTTGSLMFSTELDKYYKVIKVEKTPERMSVRFGKVSITFTVEPFAYSISPTQINLTGATDYMTVPNVGTMYSAPEIRFVPTAEQVTINVNGKDFIVSGLSEQASNQNTVVIDCDLEVVYYIQSNQKIDITYKSKYNFPLLHTGDNYIKHDGNISSMSVNVKERWL
jgi:predicted phage tail component-like protein